MSISRIHRIDRSYRKSSSDKIDALPKIGHTKKRLSSSLADAHLVHDQEPDIASRRAHLILRDKRFTNKISITAIPKPIASPDPTINLISDEEPTNKVSTGRGTWSSSDTVGVRFGDNSDAQNEEKKKKPRTTVPASFDNFMEILKLLQRDYQVDYQIIIGTDEYVDHVDGARSLFPPSLWSYIDRGEGTRRQLLISRLQHQGKTWYLMEFERRSNSSEVFAMPLIWQLDFKRFSNERELLNKLLGKYARRRGGPLSILSGTDIREKRFAHKRKTTEDFAAAIMAFIKKTTSC